MGPKKSGADGMWLTPSFPLGPHPNPRGGGEMNPSIHAGATGGPGNLVKASPAPEAAPFWPLGSELRELIRGMSFIMWVLAQKGDLSTLKSINISRKTLNPSCHPQELPDLDSSDPPNLA